jgi:hypothetical protein
MKAFKVNEILSFDRSGNNPLDKLQVGMVEERNIEKFIKALSKIGISAKKEIYGIEGSWIFELTDQDLGINWDQEYRITYMTKETAEMEGLEDEWGFFISVVDEMGDRVMEFDSKNWKEAVDYMIYQRKEFLAGWNPPSNVFESLEFTRTDNLKKDLKIGKYRFDDEYFENITEKINDVIEEYADEKLWSISSVKYAWTETHYSTKIYIKTSYRPYSIGREIKQILKILNIPVKGRMEKTDNSRNYQIYSIELDLD